MDAVEKEQVEAAKKFTAASKKIERAIAKFRVGDFEERVSDAHAQLQKALNRLSDQAAKAVIAGNDAFRHKANEMVNRLYDAMIAAEPHAREAWQAKLAKQSALLRLQQQRDWNDLPEHVREQRMNAAGLPYKPR
jgi:hypothetical protein